MSMQNVIIGLAGLVIVLGAWTYFAGNGFGRQSWQQQEQQRQQSERQRSQRQQSGRQQSDPQQQQQDDQDHEGQEEAEGSPEDWSLEEMQAWLKHRGEEVDENAETRVMLLARVQELKR